MYWHEALVSSMRSFNKRGNSGIPPLFGGMGLRDVVVDGAASEHGARRVSTYTLLISDGNVFYQLDFVLYS